MLRRRTRQLRRFPPKECFWTRLSRNSPTKSSSLRSTPPKIRRPRLPRFLNLPPLFPNRSGSGRFDIRLGNKGGKFRNLGNRGLRIFGGVLLSDDDFVGLFLERRVQKHSFGGNLLSCLVRRRSIPNHLGLILRNGWNRFVNKSRTFTY